MSGPIRRASVAGAWYPGTAPALAADVDRHLAGATREVAGDLVALVAPHAGLMYSGPVAAHAYRLLRRTTRLTTPPLLSRQAVHVMGRDQDFSNRKARALLGWEPRVGYAAGLEATLAWLRETAGAGGSATSSCT